MSTKQRMYESETARLAAERRFVQYQPKAGWQAEEHERALADIRSLINTYGEIGAWLWDPFLSAHDVLQTLFHCAYASADLRALTGALEIREGKEEGKATSFINRQRAVFADAQSNLRGLRLEFRAKIGQAGWAFHDRFLIFPQVRSGAFAWSLGTSVNSVGRQHHILQRVDDGQRVKDAFSDLWDGLNGAEHLVWKARHDIVG